MKDRIYLMRDWFFTEEFTEDMIVDTMDVSLAQTVSLPHTCKETPYHYFDEHTYQMVSCYQKILYAPEGWQGKRLLLTFEAVGHEAEVYVNGKKMAEHHCGYTAFTIDISEALHYGADNLLTVRVDSNETLDQPPFGFVIDYMTYGGIYRDVYLEVKNSIYIEDIFLKPKFAETVTTKGMDAKAIAQMQVSGILASEVTYSVKAQEAISAGQVGIRQIVDDQVVLEAPIATTSFSTPVADVMLWDIESPKVYEVTTQLLYQGQVVDEKRVTVGFREALFQKDGFYLNGRKVRIRGLNRHQSYAYVGYAMPESMQRLDAKILKEELAVNAVRTSHYPQSHYFMDACDRLGLLVFTEMPGWQHIGGQAWQDQAVENIKDMIVQYRNHPSIILWGVRINESQDNDAFYERTNATAHALDDTRQTGGVRAMKKSHLLEDVYTYNDFVHSGANAGCEPKEKVTSDVEKPYLITEYNGHMYPTKMFDWEEHRREHMIRHANVLDAVAGQEDIAGSFGWCMFDYNTHKDFGSGDRICYHGVLDMFRNPKPVAAVYASQEDRNPVLELSSTMDIGEHPACNRGDTYLISNADSVRMYKNNILIKEYKQSDSKYQNLKHGPILIDDYVGDAIAKEEGYSKRQAKIVKDCMNHVAMHGMQITPKLVWNAFQLICIYHMNPNDAVGLYNKYVGDWGGESKQYRFDAIKDGKVVRSLIKTPMKKASLAVSLSATTLVEDITYDVIEARVRAVDEYGNQLYYMQESLSVTISGPVELIGPNAVPLRGGATGLYIKSMGEPGEASVTIACAGLDPVTIKLEVQSTREDN